MKRIAMVSALTLLASVSGAWAGGKTVIIDDVLVYDGPTVVPVDRDNVYIMDRVTTSDIPTVSSGDVTPTPVAQQRVAVASAGATQKGSANVRSNAAAPSDFEMANANRKPFKLPKWLRGSNN